MKGVSGQFRKPLSDVGQRGLELLLIPVSGIMKLNMLRDLRILQVLGCVWVLRRMDMMFNTKWCMLGCCGMCETNGFMVG